MLPYGAAGDAKSLVFPEGKILAATTDEPSRWSEAKSPEGNMAKASLYFKTNLSKL